VSTQAQLDLVCLKMGINKYIYAFQLVSLSVIYGLCNVPVPKGSAMLNTNLIGLYSDLRGSA